MRLTQLRNVILFTAASGLLAACAPTAPVAEARSGPLLQAYNTPGLIKVPPYTRSIINTNNF